jgi:hypothetical protein
MDIDGLVHLSSAKWQASRYAILVFTYVQTRLILVSNFDIPTFFLHFSIITTVKGFALQAPTGAANKFAAM